MRRQPVLLVNLVAARAAVFIGVVLLGALLLGCTRSPSAGAGFGSAPAILIPSPSSGTTEAAITAASSTPGALVPLGIGIVEWDGCPSPKLGPCFYVAVLTADDGSRQAFPVGNRLIEHGHYQIRVELRHAADGPAADACETEFTTRPGSMIAVTATFGKGRQCLIGEDDVGALPNPDATPTPPGTTTTFPDACAAYDLSPARCDYIVDWATREAGITGEPARVELLGDPACDDVGPNCLINRTQAFIVRVRVAAADGTSSDHPVFCGVGGQASMLCTEAPQIEIRSAIGNGYQDVPCGTSGTDCASPVPSISAEAAAEAQSLLVPKVVIPIDHAGEYVIELGDAVLPNGVLSGSSASLANDRRTDVLIPDGIALEVLGEDGEPLWNAYDHGWRTGTERVHARLRFTVESFAPGSQIEITDVVVR
jgi:hypothetical protein